MASTVSNQIFQLYIQHALFSLELVLGKSQNFSFRCARVAFAWMHELGLFIGITKRSRLNLGIEVEGRKMC